MLTTNANKSLFIILGLLFGGFIGYYYARSSNEPQLVELSESYKEVTEQYTLLSIEYSALESDYERIKGYYVGLSETIQRFSEELDNRCSIPEALPLLLNEHTISTVGSKVRDITAEATDRWMGYQQIYNYIADEVEYVYDIEFPYIYQYRYITIDDSEVYTDFEFRFTRNYLQNPDFTLKYEQGDCDDQAILLYAMIQYYREEVLDVRYSLYLMSIFFENSSHLAVLLPVTEGKICILDPAGHYLTEEYEQISANNAFEELYNYEKHWKKFPGIEKITLYRVFKDSNYEIAVEGSLEEVSNFLTTR